jgi:hypothetical protein
MFWWISSREMRENQGGNFSESAEKIDAANKAGWYTLHLNNRMTRRIG